MWAKSSVFNHLVLQIIINTSGISWPAQVSVLPFSRLELLNSELLNLHLIYTMAVHPTAITDVKPLHSSDSDWDSSLKKDNPENNLPYVWFCLGNDYLKLEYDF